MNYTMHSKTQFFIFAFIFNAGLSLSAGCRQNSPGESEAIPAGFSLVIVPYEKGNERC